METLSDWRLKAACLNVSWDITNPANEDPGKRLCRQCPVLDPCSNYALNDQRAIGIPGVLGGLTVEERGQVACSGCDLVVTKRSTRGGKCWSCYKGPKRSTGKVNA